MDVEVHRLLKSGKRLAPACGGSKVSKKLCDRGKRSNNTKSRGSGGSNSTVSSLFEAPSVACFEILQPDKCNEAARIDFLKASLWDTDTQTYSGIVGRLAKPSDTKPSFVNLLSYLSKEALQLTSKEHASYSIKNYLGTWFFRFRDGVASSAKDVAEIRKPHWKASTNGTYVNNVKLRVNSSNYFGLSLQKSG